MPPSLTSGSDGVRGPDPPLPHGAPCRKEPSCASRVVSVISLRCYSPGTATKGSLNCQTTQPQPGRVYRLSCERAMNVGGGTSVLLFLNKTNTDFGVVSQRPFHPAPGIILMGELLLYTQGSRQGLEGHSLGMS